MQATTYRPSFFTLLLVSIYITSVFGDIDQVTRQQRNEKTMASRRLMVKFTGSSENAVARVVTVSVSDPVTVIPHTTITNPINGASSGVGTPITPQTVAPPTAANVQQQSWCVAKSGVPEASLQAALDYACGIGGANCSSIQQGASCYNPNTLQNHASFAFNNYYQSNLHQDSCDFGGAAAITNINPSSGSCIFATGTTITSPTPPSPATMNPTPTTAPGATGGLGASPSLTNSSNPDQVTPTGTSLIPPSADASPISKSVSLQPVLSCIIAAISITTAGIVRSPTI